MAWVNWGRGLVKGPRREAEVLQLGDRSYFSRAKPERLNDNPCSANANMQRKRKISTL